MKDDFAFDRDRITAFDALKAQVTVVDDLIPDQA